MATATNSKLLKMARSRDDRDLSLRTAAALTLRAQEVKGWDLPVDTRALVEWLLSNPMREIGQAMSFITANPTINSKITVIDGAISSDAVEDADIEFVVSKDLDAIAAAVRKYGTN
jgi:hypothetical protein